MIETIVGVPDYVDEDISPDRSDFESKISMMCHLIFTTKLCVECVFYQA